jgi:hypothetical protein
MCVEVKPKAGCMPRTGSAVAADSIKRRLPRFTMHQLLKHLKVRYNASITCIAAEQLMSQVFIFCLKCAAALGSQYDAMSGVGLTFAAELGKRRLPRFMMHQLLKHLKVRLTLRWCTTADLILDLRCAAVLVFEMMVCRALAWLWRPIQ